MPLGVTSVVTNGRCLKRKHRYQCATGWLGKTSQIEEPRQHVSLKMPGDGEVTEIN